MQTIAGSSLILIVINTVKVLIGIVIALLYNQLAGLVYLPLIEWWNIWIFIFLLEELTIIWFFTSIE